MSSKYNLTPRPWMLTETEARTILWAMECNPETYQLGFIGEVRSDALEARVAQLRANLQTFIAGWNDVGNSG